MRFKEVNKGLALFIVAVLIILFESIVAVLVYNEIGGDRLLISIIRMLIQVFVLFLIASSNSKVLLYLFVFYHLIVGLQFFFKQSFGFIDMLFGAYHILIVLLTFFNEEIDSWLIKKKE